MNMKQLEAELKRRINATLQDDVVKKVKELEAQHIESDVYGVYSPSMYTRRGGSGGLSDENNMVAESSDLQVSVENRTPFNSAFDFLGPMPFIPPPNDGANLALLIENGNGGGGHIYNYPYPNDTGDFRLPRPFTANTISDLSSGKLKEAFIRGLAKRGITAE